MDDWEKIRKEIQSSEIFINKFGDDIDKALEILRDAALKNVLPFENINEVYWHQLRDSILTISANSKDKRRGDRRGVCPFEGMSDGEWKALSKIMKDVELRGPEQRKSDRRK